MDNSNLSWNQTHKSILISSFNLLRGSISLLFMAKFLDYVAINGTHVAWIIVPPLLFFVVVPTTVPSMHMHAETLFRRPYRYDATPLELVVLVFPQILMPSLKVFFWSLTFLYPIKSIALPRYFLKTIFKQHLWFSFLHFCGKSSLKTTGWKMLVTFLKMIVPGCCIRYALPPCHRCPSVDTAPYLVPC